VRPILVIKRLAVLDHKVDQNNPADKGDQEDQQPQAAFAGIMEAADGHCDAGNKSDQAIQRTQKAQSGSSIHRAQSHGNNQVKEYKIPVFAPSGPSGKLGELEFEDIEKVDFERVGGCHGALVLRKNTLTISDQYSIKKI